VKSFKVRAKYLDASNPELLERSGQLGSRGLEGVCPGDDLHQEGVVVGADDGSGEGAGGVETNAHTLARPEHLVLKQGILKGEVSLYR
jgi:hypothetical protein